MAALAIPADPTVLHKGHSVAGNFIPKAGAAFFHPIGLARENLVFDAGAIRFDTVVASSTIAFGYILNGTAQTPTPGTGVVLCTNAIDCDGTPNPADTNVAFTAVTGTDASGALAGSALREKIPAGAAYGFFTNQTGEDAHLNVSYFIDFFRERFGP